MVRSTSFGWMTLAVISLLLLTYSSHCSTARGEDVLLDPNEVGVEVLLNDPNVTLNLSAMAELFENGSVSILGLDPVMNMDISSIDLSLSIFLFWSHHDPDLGVILSKENFTSNIMGDGLKPDLGGWSLSILMPGTNINTDPMDFSKMMVIPEIDKDLNALDWKTIMKVELEWMISEDVLIGLDKGDVENITGLTELGTMGLNNRVFFYQFTGEWMLFNKAPIPELQMVFSPRGTQPTSMFPDRIAPAPKSGEEKISAGLIILISSILISVLIGSYLFQRVNRAVKLNNARRKMIYERVRQNPGIHFSALMKDLDLKPGVASYHINRLEKMELIKSYQDGMYRRFYLFEDKVETKIMLSDLQKMILITVKDEPGISQVDISRMIGRSKMVINYHVRFLRDLGIIIMEREGRKTHCYLTPQGSRFAST